MKHLLTAGALALATTALLGAAGCDRRPQDRVVEKETTVVHDQPVIVHQDTDRHDGDRRPPDQGDRRDSPPPADHPGDRQDNRH